MKLEKFSSHPIQIIGLVLTGVFSLLYATLARHFAQINFQFPFLNFPVFLGEILLGACLILILILWKLRGCPLNKSVLLITAVYLLWLITKTLQGYLTQGPLALRTAALFYYPLFVFAGYCFYSKESLSENTKVFFLFFIIAVGLLKKAYLTYTYYNLTYCVLFFILALDLKNKRQKILFLVSGLLLIFLQNFFVGSRSHLIAFMAVSVYLTLSVFSFFKIRFRYLLAVLILVLSVIITGYIYYGGNNKFKSLLKWQSLNDRYQLELAFINSQTDFQFDELPVRLYNPREEELIPFKKKPEKLSPPVLSDKPLVDLQPSVEEASRQASQNEPVPADDSQQSKPSKALSQSVIPETPPNAISKNKGQESSTHQSFLNLGSEFAPKPDAILTNFVTHERGDKTIYERTLDTDQNNITFRLHIWRDMLKDMFEKKAYFWGINFGHPQRSRNIEILRRAHGEIQAVGWITPHNSFLHYFYRGGIVGIFVVVAIYASLIILIVRFIRNKSLYGILLCSIFVYWFIMAHFLVIFELPYTAIPVWTLYGLTWAYAQQFSKKHELEK